MSTNPESDWFGYKKTSPEDKTARVGDVFSSVAHNYDLMNDLMSGGLHRLWKDHLVGKMRPRNGETILDVAGGTGDISIRCVRKAPDANITVLDINADMIKVGRNRAIDKGILGNIEWIVGNAEALPIKSKSVDLLCISFGLRNVTHIDTALSEFARVLKTGGRFFCMEFSPGVTQHLKPLYDAYSFSVLPWLGKNIANDREAYQYLVESIRQFPNQEAFKTRMEQAGFGNVRHENLLGGIATIHSGWIL